MNQKEAKLFSAQLRQDLPILDLHGHKSYQALESVEQFLSQCLMKETSAVRIVYGVGTGKLQKVVLKRLRELSCVETIEDEGSSCLIILK